MKIPYKVEIKIVDIQSRIIEKEILLGIKIFQNKNEWINIFPLKTNENGTIVLFQNQIVEKMGTVASVCLLNNIKVEVEIWNCRLVKDIINHIKKLNSMNFEIIKNELVSIGFNRNHAENYALRSHKKIKNDFISWAPFFDVKNCELRFEKYKISDFWNGESEKIYKFIVVSSMMS